MPQQLTPTAEPLGSLTVPSTGDPRDSGPLRNAFQKLLNMLSGVQLLVCPPGTVLAFAGPAAPAGWLICNGQTVSRTDYAQLYAAIGTTFGAGNNTTTFNLPDLRGRTVIGAGQGQGLSNRTRGQTGGEEAHALTLQEMPSHTHLAPTAQNDTAGLYEIPQGAHGGTTGFGSYDYNGAAPTDATGGNAGHNTMPPFLALNYIIRAGG